MVNWYFRIFGTTADPEKFLENLISARNLRYSKADKYRDFRQVFHGHSSPEQGQRVLAEIFKEGMMFRSGYIAAAPLPDPSRAGKRDLCIAIMAIMNADPEKEDNG